MNIVQVNIDSVSAKFFVLSKKKKKKKYYSMNKINLMLIGE